MLRPRTEPAPEGSANDQAPNPKSMTQTRIRLDKQIQKAPAPSRFPLSDLNGELQFTDFLPMVHFAETKTTLNSVELVGGNLVIKYTGEDGEQQVVSTSINGAVQTDINLANAILEKPSAGVYRLVLTETDGSTATVDLTELLAVVTQNSVDVQLTGDGTPESPLRAVLTQAFWSKFSELTEVFRNLTQGNSVTLSKAIAQVYVDSIKVYRNGLRQELGVDYSVNEDPQVPGHIIFVEPFTVNFSEKVIVDYSPKDAGGQPLP